MFGRHFGSCRPTLIHTLLAGVVAASQPANALIITPLFDSSITSAPNSAAIERSVNSVVRTYEHLIRDPIDVSIFFTLGGLHGDFISTSQASLYPIPYSSYTSLLTANADVFKNPVLTTAVSNLGTGNTAPLVVETSADLRALGVTAATGLLGTDGVRGDGTLDGIITLRAGPGLQYSRPVASHRIDAEWAIAHELDEVLGFGGAVSILNAAFDAGYTAPPFFGGVIGGEDLYRYAGPGEPTLSLSPDARAFFSIDGGRTDTARFNQDHNFDYGDWYAAGPCMPLVQRAIFCTATSVDFTVSSPEAIGLQAVGYDLRAIPEPAGALSFLAGVVTVALLRNHAARLRGPSRSRAS